ncbi:hypothetical protein Landi51_06236 [Colletotrichum acutatum]
MTAVFLAYIFDGVDGDLLSELWTKLLTDKRERQRLRQKRSKAFSQFILTLSDQQLLTALVVLIATILGKDKLSQFEFSVAQSLALLCSTSHLATLDILRQTYKSQSRWFFLFARVSAWDMDQKRAAAHQKSDALFDAKLRLENHQPGLFYNFAVENFGDGEITRSSYATSPDLQT